MNPKILFLVGAVALGLGANAQTGTTPANPSDSTHRQGMHHRWNGDRGGAERGRFGHGREFVHYTPEQRQQVAAINKEYRQKSADLFKKDNITLKEYKAGLLSLQKERKTKMEALLTPRQKEEIAARRKRMAEGQQVMAAAHMERLKLRLNLSDDQVTKIKAGQESLRAQVKAIHENDNLLPQEKMEQMKTLMARRNETFKAVLTPEQYSQYEKMSQHRGRLGRHFGPGNRGDRGGAGEGDGADRV